MRVSRLIKVVLFAPFHLVQNLIVFLEDADRLDRVSHMLKIFFAPEMLCSREPWKALKIIYRSMFLIFWAAISFLIYMFVPSFEIPLYFLSGQLNILVSIAAAIYVAAYGISEYFSDYDKIKRLGFEKLEYKIHGRSSYSNSLIKGKTSDKDLDLGNLPNERLSDDSPEPKESFSDLLTREYSKRSDNLAEGVDEEPTEGAARIRGNTHNLMW